MPSDAAKRRQQQKREKKQAAGKKRAGGAEAVTVSTSNGIGEEASAKPPQADSASVSGSRGAVKGTAPATAKPAPVKVSARTAARSSTGVLASHPESRDLHLESLSITFHGAELLCDTKLELNCGRRYGLVGPNGSGMFSFT